MGKKGLASIFSRSAAGAPSQPWPWPSCRNPPQTASFRNDDDHLPCTTTAAAGAAAAARRRDAGVMYKTVNSVYHGYDADDYSCFEDDEEVEVLDGEGSFSSTAVSEEWSEAVIRGLGRTTSTTDRFFFDPPSPATSSSAAIVQPATDQDDGAAKASMSSQSHSQQLVEESVAVAVDSSDPYGDFRSSMAEMVAAHGLRGWDALEELLAWYLRVNGKHNHAIIVGAFVDLLLGLAATSAAAATTTSTTTTSSSSSSASTSSGAGSSSTTCDVTTTTTTKSTCAAMDQHCGGASCSSDDQEQEEEEEDEASDDDLVLVISTLQ